MGIIGASIVGIAIDLARLKHRRWKEWGAGKYSPAEQKRRLAAALRSSSAYMKMMNEGATASELIEHFQIIHTNPERFEKLTGVKWPLW